ncbi:hypothetical protein D6B99_03350 [Arachidicoccus soli]|uniref:Uncharacterized protein n=2 Tax=Arachidicoccus soli TaxID=2341117 RepID=A0A386HM92_9BACT|nr:hypothetical protein D6B99_03350 [Arachidicoccus soli]
MYAQSDYGNNGYDYNNGYNDNNNYDNNDNYYNNDYNQDDGYAQQQGGGQITFNDFYSQLSPYGRWVNDPQNGRVWIANVSNFQPYSTNGYWTYTDYGWTWVSNYNWGWAPFHYGRWGYSNYYGWYWVPGYTWGPAWVSWSTGADVYGWAPLGPGMSFGVNISVSMFPSNYWTFMPRRYMGYRNINNYYYARSRNVTYIRNTTIINNYGNANNQRYARGPQVRDVERSSGRRIQTVRVVNTRDARTTGVRNNELHVYRPAVRGSSSRSSVTPNNRSNNYTPSRSTAPTRTVVPNNQQRIERAAPQRSSIERSGNPVQRSAPVRTQESHPAIQRSAPVRSQESYQETQRSAPVRTQESHSPVQRSAPARTYSPPPTRQRVSPPERASRGNTRSESHPVERSRR